MTVLAWFVFFACAAVVASVVVGLLCALIEAAIRGNKPARWCLTALGFYVVILGLLWSTSVIWGYS